MSTAPSSGLQTPEKDEILVSGTAADMPVPPSGSPLEAALRKASEEAGAAADTAAGAAPAEESAGSAPAEKAEGSASSVSADEAESSAKAAPAETEGAAPAGDEGAAAPAVQGGGSLPPDRTGTAPAKAPENDWDNDDDEEDGEEADGEGGRMSLMDHLRELRRRLLFSLAAAFVGFLVCWSFVEPIFNVLTEPLLAVLPEGSSAMYTTLPEAFFTRMYIAFIVGLFLASPYIFYQVWAFISPGLYDEEKHFIIPVAVVSAVFFVAGGLFCYYIVFRYAFSFFMSFTTVDIVAMPKISDYLDFVLKLLLAFGLIFEMPIFAFFLSRMGVVTAAKMRSFRRYSVLLIFIVAAILTPPDVVSQLLMAVPMLLLYEVSILVAAIFGKKPAPESGPDDDPDGGADDEDSGNDGEDGGNGPAPSGGAGGLAAAAAAAAAPRVVKPVPIVPDQPELHPERLHGAAPEAGEKAAEAEPDAGAKKAAGEEKDSADAGSAEGESPAEPERYAPWDPRGELEPRENMDFEALVAAEKAAEDAGRNDNADRSVQEEPVPTTEKKQ